MPERRVDWDALFGTTDSFKKAFGYDGENLVYIGGAKPGTGKSVAGWQIKKMIYDGNAMVTDIEWADGDTEFDNIWDDRENLNYS